VGDGSVVDTNELEAQIEICAPIDLDPQLDAAVVLRRYVENTHGGIASERQIELAGGPNRYFADGCKHALRSTDPDS